MPVNLLDLPSNARSKILRFLNDQTIWQMREISKSVKQSADLSIVRSRKAVILTLEFEMKREDPDKKELYFAFENGAMWSVWASVLNRITKKLNVPRFAVYKLYKSMRVTMRIDEMEKFLEYVKPHFGKADICELTLSSCSQNAIRMCSNFLGMKSINSISISCVSYDRDLFNAYHEVMLQYRPDCLSLSVSALDRESMLWILQIASVVATLHVNAMDSICSKLSPIQIIRALINAESRKCKLIHITFLNNVDFSLLELEKILQILNNSTRKMLIQYRTCQKPIDVQVGAYKVFTPNFGGRRNTSFVGNQSVQQIRLVSKTAKESADLSFIRTRKTIIPSIEGKVSRRINAVLLFDFKNRGICAIWRSAFNCVTNKLNITPFRVTGGQERLTVKTTYEEIVKFCDEMMPNFVNADFKELSLVHCSENMTRLCTNLLSSKPIEKVSIDCKRYDGAEFDAYLHLIGQCKPDGLRVVLMVLDADSLKWLFQIMSSVSILWITVFGTICAKLSKVATIRDLVCAESKKCIKINIKFTDIVDFSLVHVEKILKILHSTTRKISIQYPTFEKKINVQVGVYKVLNIRYDTRNARRMIFIRHSELKMPR